ncbi:tetratricopeptide repeat protein [Desulfogranum japonicum]|uniref:tetratricopeptide repeat protein n=1 Tax=Desulfogranum japonicum TaxID=231447 RepID=UPI0003FA6FA2|nr:tetratricopeptide repeat protein [Desulfogranum japonicum]
MNKIRHLALAGCSLVLLTQCATQDEVRELRYQLRAVNQKLEDVKSNTVNKMQQRQASSVNKLEQIESETLRLKSLIEESAHQSSQMREQAKEDIANLQTTISAMTQESQAKLEELNQKLALFENQLAGVSSSYERLQRARVEEAERRAREAAERAAAQRAEQAAREKKRQAAAISASTAVRPEVKKRKIGDASVVDGASQPKSAETETVVPDREERTPVVSSIPPEKPSSQPSNEVTTVPADSPSSDLAKAISLYNAQKYQEAYRSLEDIVASDVQGHKLAETLFYMGECLFSQGEYDLAILDYQKVISNHSKDSLAPKALLKQGMSFEKLTDIETAKIIYSKLLNDYSNSQEAATAKQKLDTL